MLHNATLALSRNILRQVIMEDFPGRIALVSSFGAESVVLLHMVSLINPATAVLFNETGMLFRKTLDYQRDVADLLGLTNVRLVRPTLAELGRLDPGGSQHQRDADACCHLRKVAPLDRALQPFSAWITGRKRYQSKDRANLPFTEFDRENRPKINPLADWSPRDLRDYVAAYDLPSHPLVSQGYSSIGCAPCTTPVGAGENQRAGRWRDLKKTECGIHLSARRLDPAPARTVVTPGE